MIKTASSRLIADGKPFLVTIEISSPHYLRNSARTLAILTYVWCIFENVTLLFRRTIVARTTCTVNAGGSFDVVDRALVQKRDLDGDS